MRAPVHNMRIVYEYGCAIPGCPIKTRQCHTDWVRAGTPFPDPVPPDTWERRGLVLICPSHAKLGLIAEAARA